MIKTEILRKHKSWRGVIQLKIKHIESLIELSQKIFFSILAFFGALFISVIGLSSFLFNKIGPWFFIALLLVIILIATFFIYFSQRRIQRSITNYYNKLFYELLIGKIENIKEISKNEYQEMTGSLINPKNLGMD